MDVEPSALVLAPGPALPCNGDSGGPVLLAEELAGVVAFGDPACAATNTSTRIDIHLATFVDPALARIAAAAPVSRPNAEHACTACDVTDDCPRGAACIDGTCAVLGDERGGLGATCTGATCGDSPCLAGLDQAACRCLATCSDDGCGCRSTSSPVGLLVVLAVILWRYRRR
jgi:hypothetical protein